MTPLLLRLYKEKHISRNELLEGLQYVKNSSSLVKEKIAVIGMSCRMPQANSCRAFWNNLITGKNCVGSFPESRRKDIDSLLPRFINQLKSPSNPYWVGGFIDSVDEFAHEFFNILPADALLMDPQQRIFLELAYQAVADAGYTKDMLNGSNTGVFVGDVVNEYRELISTISPSAVVGNISPFIGSRVSYFFNLTGPVINISTACSTSLVAIHTALQSLILGECDLALAGAVNLRLFPFDCVDDPVDALGITTSGLACKPFDDSADGIVRGEGGGVLILKRYSAAIKDGDNIKAVILASGVNNDGKSSSVGAPNPFQQAALLKNTWKKAAISPENISYIEAHGTGTHIGDPIEIQGITSAMREFTDKKQFCGVGSVKSNIGHLTGGASGLASLFKVILSLQNKKLPASLHFKNPNRLINFENSPIYVVDQAREWIPMGATRLAGVSAFGFSGTNCHLLVEEFVTDVREEVLIDQPLPFVFSMSSQEHLEKYIRQIREWVKDAIGNDRALIDLSYTLLHRKDALNHSAGILADNISDLRKKLDDFYGKRECMTLTEITKLKQKFPISLYLAQKAKVLSLPEFVYQRKRFWPTKISDRLQPRHMEIAEKEKASDIDNSQETFLGIMKKITGYETISLKDNFFDLGGDSLLGVELISDIHKEMGVKITFEDIFKNPDLANLYQLIQLTTTSKFTHIPRISSRESYELSWGQKRIFVLDHMQQEGGAYTIYDVLDIEGPLDVEILRLAFAEIIKRHEVLRTAYSFSHENVLQKVTDVELDYQGVVIEENTGEKHLSDLIQDAIHQRFNLGKGSVMRSILYKIAQDKHVMLFMLHHIAADGYSINLIIQELITIYAAKAQGTNISLPLPATRYIDYTYWQRQLFQGKDFAKQKKFWLNRCSQLPVCYIQGDLKRPEVFSFQGSRIAFDISTEIQSLLSAQCTAHNTTLFTMLVVAVNILIYQYTSQQDIVIGTPVSGRTHKDLSKVVGFFVNTLLLRTKIDPSMSFFELLQTTKEVVSTSLDNQDYPFDLLVDELKTVRDTSRSPLFNINVAYHNFKGSANDAEHSTNLVIKRREIPHGTCKWDLEFEFTQQSDGSITCFLEYYREAYSKQFASFLIESLKVILVEISLNKNLSISDFPSITHAVVKGNQSNLVIHNTALVQEFAKIVESSPDAKAIVSKNTSISYLDLNQKANQLARLLLDLDRKSGPRTKRVGILTECTAESIIALLAIHKAKKSFVPIGCHLPEDRIRWIINHAEIDTVISVHAKLKTLQSLIWAECTLKQIIFLDVNDSHAFVSHFESKLMDLELWNSFADSGESKIMQSGWVSSFDGKPFSPLEMQEYSDNVLKKLSPFLNKQSKVLELGCGSGLTAFKLSPIVGEYFATDLSEKIIEKNKQYACENDLRNMKFAVGDAVEIIENIQERFDVVVLNSVIHCMPSLAYLEYLLSKILLKINPGGVVFLGDLMDSEKKQALIEDLLAYKSLKAEKGQRTKLSWDHELFVPKRFLAKFCELASKNCSIEITEKCGALENELTKYRYDAIIKIASKIHRDQHSHQCTSLYTLKDISYYSSDNLDDAPSIDDEAYVIYTSGTTGSPKGVSVSQKALSNYIAHGKKCYAIHQENFVYFTSLAYDLTITSIFVPIISKGTIYCLDGEFLDVLEKLEQFTNSVTIKLTPSHLSILLSHPKQIHSLLQLILGGESLKEELFIRLKKRYPNALIHNEYGPTEATVGCIVYSGEDCNTSLVPIGKPIENTGAAILGSLGQVLPVGAVGEIALFGDCLSHGYLGLDSTNASKFVFQKDIGQKVFLTGDFGRLLFNGNFECFGRRDRQVKIRGIRVELDEIEASLQKCKHVQQAAIVPMASSSAKELVGFFTGSPELDAETVKRNLSEYLPNNIIPQKLVKLTSMPQANSGKIDYHVLERYTFSVDKEFVPAQSDLEKMLEEIWLECLAKKGQRISVNADFFDLGGDSIIAMQLSQKLKELGFAIKVTDIFTMRTISRVAQTLEKFETSEVQDRDDSLPLEPQSLLPIQSWFFEQAMKFPEHFNMVFMLKLLAPIDVKMLNHAFTQIINTNPTFRLQFNLEGETVTQSLQIFEDLDFQMQEIDLSSIKASQQPKKIREISLKMQSSFKLDVPPLLRVARLKMGENMFSLLIVIHHLIIDGVSWRFLVDDLSRIIQGKKLLNISKTMYFDWIRYLHSYKIQAQELSYWKALNPDQFDKLSSTPKKDWQSKDYEEFRIILGSHETNRLGNFAESHSVSIHTLLLAVVATTLNKIFELKQIFFHLEGHGRKDIEKIDCSRVYGWFTTIYPICVEYSEDFDQLLKHIDHTSSIAAVNDVAYTVARYLHKLPQLSSMEPQILFNYFGKVSSKMLGSDEYFADGQGDLGPTTHRENTIPHLIECNLITIEDRLRVSIVANTKILHEQCVKSFRNQLESFLNNIFALDDQFVNSHGNRLKI